MNKEWLENIVPFVKELHIPTVISDADPTPAQVTDYNKGLRFALGHFWINASQKKIWVMIGRGQWIQVSRKHLADKVYYI